MAGDAAWHADGGGESYHRKATWQGFVAGTTHPVFVSGNPITGRQRCQGFCRWDYARGLREQSSRHRSQKCVKAKRIILAKKALVFAFVSSNSAFVSGPGTTLRAFAQRHSGVFSAISGVLTATPPTPVAGNMLPSRVLVFTILTWTCSSSRPSLSVDAVGLPPPRSSQSAPCAVLYYHLFTLALPYRRRATAPRAAVWWRVYRAGMVGSVQSPASRSSASPAPAAASD